MSQLEVWAGFGLQAGHKTHARVSPAPGLELRAVFAVLHSAGLAAHFPHLHCSPRCLWEEGSVLVQVFSTPGFLGLSALTFFREWREDFFS